MILRVEAFFQSPPPELNLWQMLSHTFHFHRIVIQEDKGLMFFSAFKKYQGHGVLFHPGFWDSLASFLTQKNSCCDFLDCACILCCNKKRRSY